MRWSPMTSLPCSWAKRSSPGASSSRRMRWTCKTWTFEREVCRLGLCPSSGGRVEVGDLEPWGDWTVGVLGPLVVLLLTLGAYQSLRAISSPGPKAAGVVVVLAAALVLTVGVTSTDSVP